MTDKVGEQRRPGPARKGSDASLAQKFLETIEGNNDEDITTVSIPEFNEEDCDNSIATRARVRTPQGSVAEELDEDYSVQELAANSRYLLPN